MAKVVVIGGGVSGLTTALSLLNQFKNNISELTVLASEYPGDYHAPDYTSPWAGANWCSLVHDDDEKQIKRDRFTYKVLLQLAEKKPSCGIKKYRLKYFAPRSSVLPWYIKERTVEGLVKLSDEEVKRRGMDPFEMRGFEFTTVSIDPTRYNHYLISQILQVGGTLRRIKRLDTIDQVVDVVGYVPSLVVNCTGVNAGRLLCDVDPAEQNKVYPVKGQILQIHEDLPFQVIIEELPKEDKPLPNQFLNVFPRPEGGCIVGGLAAKDDDSREIDRALSANMLRIMRKHIPELSSATVYNTYIAFRPGREGGVRIEYSEYPLLKRSSNLKVIHNYGIAGSGYQSSYAIALEVCKCAERHLLMEPERSLKL